MKDTLRSAPAGCEPNDEEASAMAQFRSKPFGVTKSGEKVNEYIISNPG